MALHIETPHVHSLPLSNVAGKEVYLKLEALQPPGSFKIRGIGLACEEGVKRGATRFISSSGGNAGLAVAYAGRQLTLPVTVVVPESTSQRARELLKLEEADVIVHGSSWQEANERALSMIGQKDAFIHPFDDEIIWRGHATMIDEVVKDGIRPDVVVVSVGGGGLMCGVIEGLHRNDWGDIPVIAVETEGAASLNAAIKAGRLVTLESISSVATSLGAKRVAQRAFDWSKDHEIQSHVVSDRSAVLAAERFLNDHRILVEPACGASLAVAYESMSILDRFRRVLIIVCGGATATIDQIRDWSRAK